jgi:two-component system, response regulator / RNA-binding antiterminator
MQISLMTPIGTSVLLVDGEADRARVMRNALVQQGYKVVDVLTRVEELPESLARSTAEVVVVYATAIDAETLGGLEAVRPEARRPVVLLSEDADAGSISAAVAAGINAHIAVGITGNRIRAAIEFAQASFGVACSLRDERDAARLALGDRKAIERAKGIIMRDKGLCEDDAYALLRSRAMKKGVRLVDVANMIIETSELMDS